MIRTNLGQRIVTEAHKILAQQRRALFRDPLHFFARHVGPRCAQATVNLSFVRTKRHAQLARIGVENRLEFSFQRGLAHARRADFPLQLT